MQSFKINLSLQGKDQKEKTTPDRLRVKNKIKCKGKHVASKKKQENQHSEEAASGSTQPGIS